MPKPQSSQESRPPTVSEARYIGPLPARTAYRAEASTLQTAGVWRRSARRTPSRSGPGRQPFTGQPPRQAGRATSAKRCASERKGGSGAAGSLTNAATIVEIALARSRSGTWVIGVEVTVAILYVREVTPRPRARNPFGSEQKRDPRDLEQARVLPVREGGRDFRAAGGSGRLPDPRGVNSALTLVASRVFTGAASWMTSAGRVAR